MIQINYIARQPNSVGGVSVNIQSLKNKSEKTIKYYTLYFVPYNAVGDKVACRITGRVEAGVTGTGPINPNEIRYGQSFENAWYNNTIIGVKITKAVIQYMDGTIETIQGSEIKNVEQQKRNGGCYVATAVYGSYDCPEVWTLRRYRDNTLAETWYGRAFIKIYYAISPFFVRHFGNTLWFKKMWRGTLDWMVEKLQDKGFESTPYEDKKW